MKKFNTVVCGGTFDHFHKGHQEFLKYSLSFSERLIIGITSDGYVQELKSQISNLKSTTQNLKSFEKFSVRKKSVWGYLNKVARGRSEIIKIDDLFGPTLEKDFRANAIVVSTNTKAGAEKINQYRQKKGLSKFKIVVAPQFLAEDGKSISSEGIRKGEIDREGKLYIDKNWLKNDLILPRSLRQELKKPLGLLILNASKHLNKFRNSFVTVGDVTTKYFNEHNFCQKISVVDFHVARKKKFDTLSQLGFLGNEKVIRVVNPAGQISPELFRAVKEAFWEKDRVIIEVFGEEDLAVIPAILIAPLGANVFYGQPGQGITKVLIDEKIKAKVREIVAKFDTRGY